MDDQDSGKAAKNSSSESIESPRPTLDQPFDGKKLFIVEIEKSFMVLASDSDDAEGIAKETVESSRFDFDFDDALYGAYEGLLYGFDKSIPYGDQDGNMTCAQIRDAWEEYEQNLPPTRAELEAAGQMRLDSDNVASEVKG